MGEVVKALGGVESGWFSEGLEKVVGNGKDIFFGGKNRRVVLV